MRAMRGLRELLVMIMNTTMIEKLLQKDIDDVAASQKFYVELRTERGSFKVDVSPGEPILVWLFASPWAFGHR